MSASNFVKKTAAGDDLACTVPLEDSGIMVQIVGMITWYVSTRKADYELLFTND